MTPTMFRSRLVRLAAEAYALARHTGELKAVAKKTKGLDFDYDDALGDVEEIATMVADQIAGLEEFLK